MTRDTLRLAVIVPADLAAGFRLAGVDTVVASTDAEALAVLERLAGEATGVVAVYQPFLDAFPTARRERWEQSVTPVVIGIPTGRGDDGPDRVTRLEMLLQRAVGYHIRFEGGSGE